MVNGAYSDCHVLQNDICVKRGDRRTHRFFLKDSNGVAIDVVGLSAKLAVNPDPAPTNTLGQLFEIVGVPSAPSTLGYFDFKPSAPQALQTPDTYFYDVQVTDGTTPITIAEGQWKVDPDIADAGT